MTLLTREYLTSLGIQLDDEQYQLLDNHFQTTLHDRVVDAVVAELTPEQAEELARLHSGNDETIYDWLKQNVPDFADIVADEVDILLGEIAEDSDKL